MEVVMPVLTSFAFSSAAPLGHALIALWRSLSYRASKFVRAIENRRAAQALARFDDRALADIGLTRGDLHDVYAKSLWSDPTNLLRARALERRLARHGISHGLSPDDVGAPPIAPKVDSVTLKQASAAFCGCT
jgi:uncharacterized protein YjiS (DUF1127 family)